MTRQPVTFSRKRKGKRTKKPFPIFKKLTPSERAKKAWETRRKRKQEQEEQIEKLKKLQQQQMGTPGPGGPTTRQPSSPSKYAAQWEVESSSTPGTYYTISQTHSGEWQCDCAAWKFTKGHRKDCKHIKEVKAAQASGQPLPWTEEEEEEEAEEAPGVIEEKGDFKHPMKPAEPTAPPPIPDEVTLENYHKMPVPETGPIGKKYAPLIHWDKIQTRYKPPPPGSVAFLDYPHDDAPKGVLPELREAFERNREYVSQGKDPVNVILQGPAGTGKSIAVKKFAEEVQLPYYFVPAEPAAMTSEQLLGRKEIEVTPEGVQQTVWHDGTMVMAARTGGILHIEEFSLLDPEVTPRLHEFFDSSRRLSLEGLSGEVVKAHPDLFVIVTMNPAELGIAGVKPLSQPIRRRFRGIVMDYPPPDIEANIIKKQVRFTDDELKIDKRGNVSGTFAEPIVGFMRVLKDLRGKAEDLSYMPTASEAVDFGRELKAGATVREAAHRALIGKYVGEDRTKIKESIRPHVELTNNHYP